MHFTGRFPRTRMRRNRRDAWTRTLVAEHRLAVSRLAVEKDRLVGVHGGTKLLEYFIPHDQVLEALREAASIDVPPRGGQGFHRPAVRRDGDRRRSDVGVDVQVLPRALASEVGRPATVMAMGVLVERFMNEELAARAEFAARFDSFASKSQRGTVKDTFG